MAKSVIGIDKDGNYYLDKKPYGPEAVGQLLNQIYSNPARDDHTLFLRADQKLPYSKVLDAEELAMKNKVAMLGMVGEQTPGTASTIKGDIVAPGGKK